VLTHHNLQNDRRVRVWDPLVRMFHWILAASFLIAWLSGGEWLELHVAAGYVILGLVLIRVVWGVVGTRHARFADFVYSPSIILAYLKDVIAVRARRYLGHNPAGGAMIVVMLVSLTLAVVSGLVLYGYKEFSGPLSGLLVNAPAGLGGVLKESHEFFANFTVLLVVLHLAGVVLTSVHHGENLVRSMINGYKQQETQ